VERPNIDRVRAALKPRPRRPHSAAPAAPASPAPAPQAAELAAQRDRLIEKFTVMQADLGGAFYEMAIRDHVRMDVLTRKAAELQAVDAELEAVERELALAQTDAAGVCATCGTPYARSTRFCTQCGSAVGAVAGVA
jgi:hypothetical protein